MRDRWLVTSSALALMTWLVASFAPATAQDAAPDDPFAGLHDAEHADAAHGDAAHGDHAEDLGHGNAGAQLEDASEFQTDLAIYTFVVFLCLLAILSKFAWPVLVQALEAREQHIADQISAAEQKHQDAKQLLSAHEARLASAADEVRELLDEARRDAEHTKTQIVAEAKKAAEDERNRAVRDVEIAKDTALHELARSSANLAIDLAQRVVQEQISTDRQADIVREAISKLNTVSNN